MASQQLIASKLYHCQIVEERRRTAIPLDFSVTAKTLAAYPPAIYLGAFTCLNRRGGGTIWPCSAQRLPRFTLLRHSIT